MNPQLNQYTGDTEIEIKNLINVVYILINIHQENTYIEYIV
jgi:hypothetical protein